jgi:hypothetical protein
MPTDLVWTAHAPDPPPEVPDVAAALAGGPTALVLNLEPIVGVQAAKSLSARGLAAVVLVLPRWPHVEAVLPTARLVEALVHGATDLSTKPTAGNVVFVLDGERTRSMRRPPGDPRVDNRYDIGVGDLPNLEQLQGAGIRRVVTVTHAPRS